MKHVFQLPKPILVGIMLCLLGISVAWQLPNKRNAQDSSQQNNSAIGDTSQPGAGADKQDLKINLNENEEFDEAMKNLDVQIKNIDFEKINAETQKAMKNIDWQKMNKDIQKSMDEVKVKMAKMDYKKIMDDAMKEVNTDEMKVNIESALQNAQVQIAAIDEKKIQEQLQQVQSELKSKEFTQQFNNDEIQESLKEAQKQVEVAKLQLKNWKEFSNALEKDGLIQKSKPYTIQLKDGTLYINDQKQIQEVTDKYSKYYQGRKNFTINMNGENNEAEEKDSDKQ